MSATHTPITGPHTAQSQRPRPWYRRVHWHRVALALFVLAIVGLAYWRLNDPDYWNAVENQGEIKALDSFLPALSYADWQERQHIAALAERNYGIVNEAGEPWDTSLSLPPPAREGGASW